MTAGGRQIYPPPTFVDLGPPVARVDNSFAIAGSLAQICFLLTRIADALESKDESDTRDVDKAYEDGHANGYARGVSEGESKATAEYNRGYRDGRATPRLPTRYAARHERPDLSQVFGSERHDQSWRTI